MANKPLATDYVYLSEETGEFRSAHVAVNIGSERVELSITSDDMMLNTELDSVIANIEGDILKKAHIALDEECQVIVKMGGQTYEVSLNDSAPRVKGMTQL